MAIIGCPELALGMVMATTLALAKVVLTNQAKAIVGLPSPSAAGVTVLDR